VSEDAVSFRDFITNPEYRRRLAASLARYGGIKPPANPSRRYIDDLVQGLLDERTAQDAMKELSIVGAAAVPSLAAALTDERFRQAERKSWRTPAPLDAVLGLLVPHGAEHLLAAATPLADAASNEVRKTAALHLASLGRTETLPILGKLLQDTDGYVRSYVRIGLDRAIESGRGVGDFQRGAYDLLLAQCDQEWTGSINDAAKTVVALDPARAAVDFASPRWLSISNPHAHQIIEACNRAGILLPETLVLALLEHALPLATGDRCYPHQYVAAAALESLAMCLGEQSRPLLQVHLTNQDPEIREGAARGIAKLTGSVDPVAFVLQRAEKIGFDGLTPPQRIVYCAFLFDAEVCNGGIMQFFGNSSGDHTAKTLDALRELAHPEAEVALSTAIAHVGPLALEPDREMRLAAFEDRYDQLQTEFGPLEEAYYETQAQLRQKMLLYAAKYPGHFGG
jgi:hypothetical protein